MEINEVIQTPEGAVTCQLTLNPEQVTVMTRWFLTQMLQLGAMQLDNKEQNEGRVLL